MKEAETILRLIEEADPNDTMKLDEIDARVWCYLKEYQYLSHMVPSCKDFPASVNFINKEGIHFQGYQMSYCQSRDALKLIRPHGVRIYINNDSGDVKWDCIIDGITPYCFLPTEELAELHAIIQSIEYERTKQ